MAEDTQHVGEVCRHCPRDADERGLCKYHLIREELAGLCVGDEVYINDYGPFMVRSKEQRANYKGDYIDTNFKLVGNREDGSIWQLRVFANDSGRRGTGRPGYVEIDDDGSWATGANHIHRLRFAEVPENKEIIAEKHAGELIDDVQ